MGDCLKGLRHVKEGLHFLLAKGVSQLGTESRCGRGKAHHSGGHYHDQCGWCEAGASSFPCIIFVVRFAVWHQSEGDIII